MHEIDALVRSHYNELDRQREHQEYLDEINEMRFADKCSELEEYYENEGILKTDDEIEQEAREIIIQEDCF